MEEVLSNQEARPGDTTQLMHAIFSSDDEMMAHPQFLGGNYL